MNAYKIVRKNLYTNLPISLHSLASEYIAAFLYEYCTDPDGGKSSTGFGGTKRFGSSLTLNTSLNFSDKYQQINAIVLAKNTVAANILHNGMNRFHRHRQYCR